MQSTRSTAIYVRMSRDTTGERMGVKRQLEDCEKMAADLGWTVVEVYEDNDISAYSGKLRPAYRRMLDDIRDGRIDGVIAWHTDRLHRSPRELEDYIEICEKAGAVTRTVKAGLIDLTTASGQVTARILGAVASGESRQKAERIKRAIVQQAAQGKPRKGGKRAYGYESDRVTLREGEAAVIKELVTRFLAGDTLAALARSLNESGTPTPSGSGRWSPSAVRTIIRSARISGQREHLGQIVAVGNWPAIVTPDDTARVRQILDADSRKTERAPRRYLLTRLVVCGRCQNTMISHPQRGVARYECRSDGGLGGCGSMSITAGPLEDYVRDMTLTALDGPELASALGASSPDTGTADIAESIARREAQLAEIMAERVAGEITRDEWAVAQRVLNDAIDQDRRALASAANAADIGRYLGKGADLTQRWKRMTLDQKRAVITSTVREVVIDPASRRGPGVDLDRVSISWRA